MPHRRVTTATAACTTALLHDAPPPCRMAGIRAAPTTPPQALPRPGGAWAAGLLAWPSAAQVMMVASLLSARGRAWNTLPLCPEL